MTHLTPEEQQKIKTIETNLKGMTYGWDAQVVIAFLLEIVKRLAQSSS